MKIAVLGAAGAIGSVIVRDLLDDAEVSSILLGEQTLETATALLEALGDDRLEAAAMDVHDIETTASIIEGCDVVINNTQYYQNLEVMRAALQARCHYVDLGGLFHMTRKQLLLDDAFRDAGLLAILGCGSTPGITNIMARYAADRLEEVESIDIQVGSIDRTDGDTGGFSLPYAVETILDEFVLPPYIYEGEQWVELPPFSGAQELLFPPPIGRADAHYILHSEIASLPTLFQTKGLRRVTVRIAFPAELIRTLKLLVDLHLADSEPRAIGEVRVRPRDLLVNVLAPHAAEGITPSDWDCIRVEVAGRRARRTVHYTMETLVKARPDAGACAFDAGVPAAIAARMLASGDITERGVMAPERCIAPPAFFEALARRGIHVDAVVRERLA